MPTQNSQTPSQLRRRQQVPKAASAPKMKQRWQRHRNSPSFYKQKPQNDQIAVKARSLKKCKDNKGRKVNMRKSASLNGWRLSLIFPATQFSSTEKLWQFWKKWVAAIWLAVLEIHVLLPDLPQSLGMEENGSSLWTDGRLYICIVRVHHSRLIDRVGSPNDTALASLCACDTHRSATACHPVGSCACTWSTLWCTRFDKVER